ncbi:hypothetical protein Angca_006662 [Angiostrongylus cantonensis]|nr:hypothetical protein Angca_006662 [Angiostrongylus cantonensis]
MSSSRSRSSTSKRSSGGSRRERNPRARSLGSPKISPPSTTQSNDLLKITIKSVMEGVHGAKVLVPSTCNVSELKTIVADATDVSPEKQLLLYNNKELKPNSVLYIPPAFPQGSVTELRSKIKSMTNVRGSAMDCSPSVSSTELKSDKSNISASNAIGISESAIKAFFEPPETVIEMELRKKHFLLAPSNMEELNAVKARREALLKTVCKVCNGKLKPAEQQMPCACSYVFCKHHRKPDTHLCNIDHRQMGRSKISKENPKMVFGGIRKAKMTPHP